MKLNYDRNSKDPTYFIQMGIRNGKKEKGQKSIISVLLYFSNSRHTVP